MTICTWHRRPLLTHPAVADAVTGQLLTQSLKGLVDVAAYCLMPDHLHALLIVEDPRGDIRLFIERFKQFTGYSHARHSGCRLWQPSYFDYSLRSDEATVPTVAYIVNNPVRAGFVPTAEIWPFWGSSRWSRTDLLEAIATAGPGRRPG